MAANRLNASTESGGRDLEIGETRYVCARDTKGEIVKEYTLTRTARPYVYDLCDAYNASMSEAARQRGLIYIVTGNGELKLTDYDDFIRWNTRAIERRKERERQEFVRNSQPPPRPDDGTFGK